MTQPAIESVEQVDLQAVAASRRRTATRAQSAG